jgi:hypothetical protein
MDIAGLGVLKVGGVYLGNERLPFLTVNGCVDVRYGAGFVMQKNGPAADVVIAVAHVDGVHRGERGAKLHDLRRTQAGSSG